MNTIDIHDIGHIYFSTGTDSAKYLNRPIDNFFSKNCFLGAFDFILKSFHSLLYYRKRFKPIPPKYNGVLVFGLTVNNRNSLLPIIECIGKEQVCAIIKPKDFPMWRVYLYAYPHLFSLLKQYKIERCDNKKAIRFFFSKFWRIYGCQRMAIKMLDYYKPKVVVLANDHTEMNRCLMNESNAKGVNTLYVQHASITEKFPPLHFSYSMLDGYDSFLKYKEIGDLRSVVYLSGGVRFDAIQRNKNSRRLVGVAMNTIDDEAIVKETCLIIKSILKEGENVILRPHPMMDQQYWNSWCNENHIEFSSSREENSFIYLSRLKLLVSNQSSIHLDAAMCHTPAVVYNLSNSSVFDHYGYKEKGLVPEVESIEELKEFLNDIEDYEYNEKIVKYFNSSYKAPFEGKVAPLIANLIETILTDTLIDDFNKKNGFTVLERGENDIVYHVPAQVLDNSVETSIA